MSKTAPNTVVVCAVCRAPVDVGMRVVVFHPEQVRGWAAATGRALRALDDRPVMTCVPCGNPIRTWRLMSRVQ